MPRKEKFNSLFIYKIVNVMNVCCCDGKCVRMMMCDNKNLMRSVSVEKF